MFKIVKLSTSIVLGLGLTVLHSNGMKKFEIKSAKIAYTLKGSGNIMGISQVKILGKKNILFDAYGLKYLEEKEESRQQTTMGETQVTNSHTLTYMNDAILYHVNYAHQRIERMQNPTLTIGTLFGNKNNLNENTESLMKKMGGKYMGKDTVLGYSCDVWDLMGAKQCVYKGVSLKSEVNIMGLKTIEVATKIEWNIALNDEDFTLPSFPIYDNNHRLLSKTSLVQLDKEENARIKIEATKKEKAMQGMAAGLAALAQTGFDMQLNTAPTPKQEKLMQNAMMNAMGGEANVLAKMKKEILEDTKGIAFAESCFSNANTLTEANSCIKQGNQQFQNDEEYFHHWNASKKHKLLQEIHTFKLAVPCIQSAQSMDALSQCIPELH